MAEEATKQAQVAITIRESEYKFLLRLRQLRNEAGDKPMRFELELTKTDIAIISTPKTITREIFA